MSSPARPGDPIAVMPDQFVIPGLSGNLLRQRLQHRALAASQPCTGKCALTLQPTAAFHHRHPRLDQGSCRAFGRARGEPFGAELPAAPSRQRPHIPAAVPRSARSDSHPSASCASIRRTSPSSSLVRFRAKMYSTGISSSQLGTKSPDFVLNRNLKFAVGNKKPRFCTQLDPQVRSWEQKAPILYSTGSQVRTWEQIAPVLYSTGIPATSFIRDIPDCPVVLPNSCSSISLLRHSVAGQCAAIAEIGRCCTSIGLLRSCRAVQCAATLETELRRAVTVGMLHVNRPHRPLAGRVIVQHRLKMDSGAQMRSGCCTKPPFCGLPGVVVWLFWGNAAGLNSLRSRIKKISGAKRISVL